MTAFNHEAGPRMIIFAGPNGSGKSTITKKARQSVGFPRLYINADDIARDELQYIPDVIQRNIEAAEIAESRRQAALKDRQPFSFETVMSTPGKLAIFQEAQAHGFFVALAFVTTRDPKFNIDRVANRVALGGHDVSPDKIIERYERAMRLLPSAVYLADAAEVFDNSLDEAKKVFVKYGANFARVNAEIPCNWVQKRLIEPYRNRMESRARMESVCRQETADYTGELKCVLTDALISNGEIYRGVVVDVDDYHILQRTDAHMYIIHDRVLCPQKDFQIGQDVTIPYFYEKGGKHKEAVITEESHQTHEQALPKDTNIELHQRRSYESSGPGF